MNIEAIRELFATQPFQPLIIHLADGREIFVPHKDFLLFPPAGRLLIVYRPDDAFHIIETLLITDLEVRPNLQPPASHNGK